MKNREQLWLFMLFIFGQKHNINMSFHPEFIINEPFLFWILESEQTTWKHFLFSLM